MWLLASAAYAQTPVSGQARSVRLSLAGWSEEERQEGTRVWRDRDGDVLILVVLDSPFAGLDFSTEVELQNSARQLAQQLGGGLIEVGEVAPRPRSIVILIYKRLQLPAYVYS